MPKRQGTIFIDKKPLNKVKEDDTNKLKRLVKQSHRIIFRAKAVFPFDFFPSEIVIDENKVDILDHVFFYSSQRYTILIKNINSATVSSDLLFGNLIIEIENNNLNPPPLRFLKKADAIKARRIINGMIVCMKEKIDLSKFDIEVVKKKVEEIGQTHE